MSDDKRKGLKVTDRRMVTPEGVLRTPPVAEEVTAAEEKAPADTGRAPEPPVEQSRPRPPAALPKPGFADLVSILAEPIAIFLGDVQLGEGGSAENLELARFHIDLLGVLKEKTESNLSHEESAVLDDLLYRLRMRYVQKSE